MSIQPTPSDFLKSMLLSLALEKIQTQAEIIQQQQATIQQQRELLNQIFRNAIQQIPMTGVGGGISPASLSVTPSPTPISSQIHSSGFQSASVSSAHGSGLETFSPLSSVPVPIPLMDRGSISLLESSPAYQQNVSAVPDLSLEMRRQSQTTSSSSSSSSSSSTSAVSNRDEVAALAEKMMARIASQKSSLTSSSSTSSSASNRYGKSSQSVKKPRKVSGPVKKDSQREVDLVKNGRKGNLVMCETDLDLGNYVATIKSSVAVELFQGNYLTCLDGNEVIYRVVEASESSACSKDLDLTLQSPSAQTIQVKLSECLPFFGERNAEYPYAFVQSITSDKEGAYFFLLHNARYQRNVDGWVGQLVSVIQGEDGKRELQVTQKKMHFNHRLLGPLGFVRVPKQGLEAQQFVLNLLSSQEITTAIQSTGDAEFPHVCKFKLG